jgi:hypothetical protein
MALWKGKLRKLEKINKNKNTKAQSSKLMKKNQGLKSSNSSIKSDTNCAKIIIFSEGYSKKIMDVFPHPSSQEPTTISLKNIAMSIV